MANKVCVITGAGGILCSSFAEEMAKRGYAVALLDLNEEAAQAVADKINDASKGTHLFTKTKRFGFLKPEFSFDVTGNGTEFTATVGADCYVKGVELSFGDVEATVDRNYFDITGTAPVRIQIRTPRITTVEKLKRVIQIRSVYDLGRED